MSTSNREREKLEFIFNCEGQGLSPAQMARGSDMLFVRSQDLLAVYHQKGSGRVLSAWEALQTFGADLLYEAVVDGSSVIVYTRDEPARTVTPRKKELGLTNADIAKHTRLSLDDIHDIENTKRKNSIQNLETIARCLGLDERSISFKPGSGGDSQLAIRLIGADFEKRFIRGHCYQSRTRAYGF
jgi:transcriptional regulator with XRE-family HTH domain